MNQELTHKEWVEVLGVLSGRAGARARRGGSTRNFIAAVLWVARTGARWSDIPKEFGRCHCIYVRFTRWAQEGRWDKILTCLSNEDGKKDDLRALVNAYLNRREHNEARAEYLSSPRGGFVG